MFEALVEDSIDSDLAYQLMNNAKDKIEDERDWSFLKKLDTDAATSSAIPLPADYKRTISLYVGTQPYLQILFEQKQLFQNSALRWYLDFANSNYYIIGSNVSGTIYHNYIYQTSDISALTSPVWPSRFHKLLAFEMAILYFAVDQGDRGRSWDDKWNVQYQLLHNSMVDWDIALQKRAVENAVPFDFEPEVDVGLM